jgi:hypothetical protein
MVENFFTSMLSEGGKISHKRFISVLATFVVCIIATFVAFKYDKYSLDIIHSFLIFVAVMSGVATVAQIVSLVKGTPIIEAPKDDKTKQPTT